MSNPIAKAGCLMTPTKFRRGVRPMVHPGKMLLLTSVLACTACSTLRRHSEMVIEGYVLDNEGHPASKAHIEIVPIGSSRIGPSSEVVTGDDGEFRIPITTPDIYRVFAWDEVRRVPYPAISINTPVGWKPLDITVSKGATLDEVTLTLPKPYGLLSGTVTDADTGEVIDHARIWLERANDPQIYMARSVRPAGELNLLLPDEPIRVRITAPGYAEWVYHPSGSGPDSVRLSAGEDQIVEVRLHRIEPVPDPASADH